VELAIGYGDEAVHPVNCSKPLTGEGVGPGVTFTGLAVVKLVSVQVVDCALMLYGTGG